METKNKPRCRITVIVSLAVIGMFVVASQYAAANWRLGAILTSSTRVENGPTCYASTGIFAIPIVLSRGLYDWFWVWDNASWQDNRQQAGSPDAYHNFTLRMDYLGSPHTDSHRVVTHSGDNGAWSLNVSAQVLQLRQWAYLNWTASVFVTGPNSCSQFSSDQASFFVG
jgi:hypothetical protein